MAALETRGVAEMDDTRNRATPAREGEEEGEKGEFWKKELSGVDDREGEPGEIHSPRRF